MNINLRPKKCSGQSRYGRYGSYATEISLLELHTERRIIELKAIEGTEKKYYESYLLHAKKSKNQEFKCGGEVWIHHPEKYGMVVVPMQYRVIDQLSDGLIFGRLFQANERLAAIRSCANL